MCIGQLERSEKGKEEWVEWEKKDGSVLSEVNPGSEERAKWGTIGQLPDFAFFVHWHLEQSYELEGTQDIMS